MRLALPIIACLFATPALAITVPPELQPPALLQPLPPAAQSMMVVTGQRPGITARQRMVPPQLSEAERIAWRKVFLDLDAGRFSKAEAAIAAQPPSLLGESARAALIAARGAGRLTRADLAAWLAANADQPLAARIARLAEALPGADAAPLPLLPEARPFRTAAAPGYVIERGPADTGLADRLKPLLAGERNDEA
ncbi:MAG: hypothetical protein ACOYO0_10050, partial [Sandarakinorhabdus sp.]